MSDFRPRDEQKSTTRRRKRRKTRSLVRIRIGDEARTIDADDYRIYESLCSGVGIKVDENSKRIICIYISGDCCADAFPEEILRLSALKVLNARASSLPPFIGLLQKLTELHFRNTELYFRDEDDHVLPEEIGDLRHLKKLDLRDGNITSLPKSIGNLTKLEHLDLGWNLNLRELPEEIGGLRNLRSLDLHRTRISRLPDGFGDWQQLEFLDISCTNIADDEFPEDVWRLSSLRTLMAPTSCISIPPTIEDLENLQQIKIGVRGDLPKEFGNLKNLIGVDLRMDGFNNMLSLSTFTNLPHLNRLGIWIQHVEENFDFRQLNFLKKIQKLKYFKLAIFENEEDDLPDDDLPDGAFEFALDLVQTTPSLIDVDAVLQEGRPEITNALSINRFRRQSPFRRGMQSSSTLLKKMWPRMLSNASGAFYSPDDLEPTPFFTIEDHDAVHKILVDGRESFLEVLRDRNKLRRNKRRRCRKIY